MQHLLLQQVGESHIFRSQRRRRTGPVGKGMSSFMTDVAVDTRPRLRKGERRERILLELKLRPHVRISDLADDFGVSSETVRRDFEALSADGLISRAHGGASSPALRHYPGFDERNRARIEEREKIGRAATGLVRPGDSIMIDSGSTTLQLARFLAFEGTPCTVVTNSLPIAMALGQSNAVEVILCPGDYLRSESALVGTDTVEYLEKFHVDRCLIGASGLTPDGLSEDVRGFAAVKRAMLRQSAAVHLLIDREKFGRTGLSRVGEIGALTSLVVDRAPAGVLGSAVAKAGVEVIVAN